MIKKYLVFGKNLQIVSQHPDQATETTKFVELDLTLDAWWKAQELMKDYEYILSTNEPPAESQVLLKKLMKHLVQWVVDEKQRVALREKYKIDD